MLWLLSLIFLQKTLKFSVFQSSLETVTMWVITLNAMYLLLYMFFFYICLQKKQTRVRATYTTTKPIAFVVTKSSSKDSAALSANTQCFKSRPVRKTVTVDNQHCQWTVTKTLPDPSHLWCSSWDATPVAFSLFTLHKLRK